MVREAPRVVLASFEGPLELLWHLIDRDKLNIYDIPIAHVTDQYMQYLQEMEWREIDIAGDFVLMATQLVQLKLRMLLPRPVRDDSGEDSEDPRQELVDRLLSYRAFQTLAGQLEEGSCQQSKLFPRAVRLPNVTVISPLECDAKGLARLMGEVVTRSIPAQARISRQQMTIGQCMRRLLVKLNNAWRRIRQGASFSHLVGEAASRQEWVMNFLSLLELMRRKKVRAEQEQPLTDIEIYPYRARGGL